MYNSLSIRGFQSIKSLDLELGRLTLITGESHAGKSASVRCLQAIASNIIGTEKISQGSEVMSVTLDGEECKVTLQRTVKGRDDYYKIVNHRTGEEATFRTLGVGGVPEEVTKALKIDPVGKSNPSINFHLQLDKPYLLTESGAVVARELGELTNVTTIFEAVREGNRRRTGLNTELKSNQKSLDAALAQAKQYQDIPGKDEALTRAEEALEKASELHSQIEVLEASVQALTIVDKILARPVPSTVNLARQLDRIEELDHNLRLLVQSSEYEQAAASAVQGLQEVEASLHEALHEALIKLGVCPTCGSVIQ